MYYDFDEIIDRSNTGAIKVDRCKTLFGTENVIPLWVADMDFRTPDFILESIIERIEHPILGYTEAPQDYFESVIRWLSQLHHWSIEREWLGFMPGIVPGIAFAVNAFTERGDEIIVQPPVYPPFLNVPANNIRNLVVNPLKEVDGRFEMDFEDLEKKITDKTKLLILCNPHNPGGRVWDVETLKKLAEICYKRGVLVISDEIHSDMAIFNHCHTPFATVSEYARENSVTFMAPSKTFNMAGLISSFYIAPNKEIRTKFAHFLAVSELTNGNIFAYVAARAAFTHGNEWRKQMLSYIEGNINFVVNFLKEQLPQIKPMIPEASFLLWLDFEALGMETNQLQEFLTKNAGLGLNKGTTFGPGGEYHARLNVGSPRSVLANAMRQLKEAVELLEK